MKQVAVLIVLACACAPPGDDDAPLAVQQLRQPGAMLMSMPSAKGEVPDARLGTSVSACRGGLAFAAGAPGINTAFLFPARTPLSLPGAIDLGLGVACAGSATSPELAAFGSGQGLWYRASDGGVVPLLGMRTVRALARSDSPFVPVLAGADSIFAVSATGPSLIINQAGEGQRLAFAPLLSDQYVSSNATTGTITVFNGNQTAGTPFQLAGAVTAVAHGDLHPRNGLEVAVAFMGKVEVWSVTASPQKLMTLFGTSGGLTSGFGQSLAVDGFDAGGGLSSLWVGSPGEGRVYRFLGDAGDFIAEVNGVASEYGWALATDSRAQVHVGAPSFSDSFSREGAVFSYPIGVVSLGLVDGVTRECDVLAGTCFVPLSASLCQVGTCIGGVVCGNFSGTMLCPPSRPDGGPDAAVPFDGGGTVDAGGGDGGPTTSVDGGINTDGGSRPDGGAGADGGRADGGAGVDGGAGADGGAMDTAPRVLPDSFATCGCTSPAFAPLALLALAAVRVRVRRGGRRR